MTSKTSRVAVAVALRVAGKLPVGVMRAANQRLHASARGRRVLHSIWTAVAEQPAVIPRGPLAGSRFAAGGGQPGYLLGASEPDLQRAFEQHVRPGDVVYDIGANVGFFALLGARLATPTGHVYAFEPMDANVRSLRRNLELNDVRHADIVQAAVSDSQGRLRMSRGYNQATGHLAEVGDDLLEVTTTTVDAFVAAGHRRPSVVKIDVEGAEDRVLEGMRATLSDHRPVVLCELHYEDGDPRRAAITDLLRDVGYEERLIALEGGSMAHLVALPRAASR
jgi:FkbM family methyltransferase